MLVCRFTEQSQTEVMWASGRKRKGEMQAQQELLQILDAIETGKYKSAHALATKAIKKTPKSVVIKAMLAYATEKTGKPQEAVQMCRELISLKPAVIEDLSLQLISQCLRSARQFEDVVTLYANASSALPSSVEFATHHYMSLVRVGNLKQQQLVALKMHKQFKENKYLFWAVTSIFLQVCPESQGAAVPAGQTNIYLPLAEKMLDKAQDENRISSFEEVYLHMMVMKAQKKHLGCVKLLSSEISTRLCKVEPELKHLVLESLNAAEQTDSVLELCRDGLREMPDDWRIYVIYVQALYTMIVEHSDEAVQIPYQTQEVMKARAFIESLQTGKSKGPYLGEIELLSKFSAFEGDHLFLIISIKHTLPDLVPLLLNFFVRFGATISFFEDLKRYLTLVPWHLRETFLANIQNAANEPEKDEVSAFRKRVNYYKVKFCITSEFSKAERAEFSRQLSEEYNRGIELGKYLNTTERQPGDDCLVIAALLLITEYDSDQRLEKSSYNFQMKIMLIRLYAYLGVSQPVVTHSISLDIKQVQLDTLTYIYADDFETYSPIDVASQITKKSPEMIIQAYKFGTYSKIPEFQKFHLRLRHSIQQAVSKRQVALLDIISLSCGSKIKDLTGYLAQLDSKDFHFSDHDIQTLVDNRDRTMDVSWKAEGQSFFQQISRGEFPKPKANWIKLYGTLPLILKGWFSGNEIEPSLLKSLDGISEEDEFGLKVFYQLSQCFCESSISSVGLAKTVDMLNAKLINLTSCSAISSGEDCRKIHDFFKAIVFCRIALLVLQKMAPSALSQFEDALERIATAFVDYIMELRAAVSSLSVDTMTREWVLTTEDEIPLLVAPETIKNVLEAVQSSYKAFLESIAKHLM
ncbi:N-acetyltransferase B complex non catalytic subunit-domain-containing protein [Chytriomyces sp. MP71]|nr:N-acetyltransferase B complex non catalytic subunit-domain-containing protein [Chytriomyces sp. MP71]